MSFLKSIFGKGNKNKVDKSQKTQEAITACPYCGTELEKKPTRKKKCPHCADYIYVRQGQLLTEDEVNIIDWLVHLDQFGIDRPAYDRAHGDLSKQFGKEASVNDTVWRILNSLLVGKSGAEPIHVYWCMARMARIEGNDPGPYILESARMRLMEYKRSGVTKVHVMTCNDDHVCPECNALIDKVFSIDDVIENMPIPNHCTSPNGCRCHYSPVVDRTVND